jgi:DNA polymerase-3 subunit beta
MKLTVERESLKSAMGLLAPVAKRGASLPVLSCVLLRAGRGGLVLTASNLEQTLRVRVAADVDAGGEVCVSAALLAKLAGEMDGDTVALAWDAGAGKLTVECGGFTGALLTVNADDFVPIPAVKGVEIPAAAEMFDIHPFASTDETRFVLCGVHLGATADGPLSAVATDGKRLAVARFDAPGAAVDITIPTEACRLFARLCGGGTGATLVTDGKFARLTAPGGVEATTNLIQGNYPNWRQVVPTQFSGGASFETPHLFREALHRVALLTDEKSIAVKLAFDNGAVEMRAAAADVGEAAETVPAMLTGKPCAVALNPEMLLPALARAGSYEIRYSDGMSPVVVEGGAFCAVVMPMRIA